MKMNALNYTLHLIKSKETLHCTPSLHPPASPSAPWKHHCGLALNSRSPFSCCAAFSKDTMKKCCDSHGPATLLLPGSHSAGLRDHRQGERQEGLESSPFPLSLLKNSFSTLHFGVSKNIQLHVSSINQ